MSAPHKYLFPCALNKMELASGDGMAKFNYERNARVEEVRKG
jgi:hypothetical protein